MSPRKPPGLVLPGDQEPEPIPQVLRLDDGTLHPACPVADVLRNELAVMNQIGTELGIGSNEFVTKRAEILRAALDIGWWELWLKGIATSWVSKPFAGWHYRLWQWAMAIEPGVRPSPLVVCAPRGSGKTAMLQLVTLALAARRTRNYAIYVGATQSAVEDKVAGIGELIQSEVMAQAYPEVSRIYTTNTGSRRDWRKSRIRTNSGFTLDAFGLDQAIRGARVDDDRPGFICADDIESQTDTAYMTQKRQDALTKAVLPSGSDDAAIVFIQNKIHQASLMAQLLDGTAEFMADRVAIGPIRQVDNLTYIEREPTPGDGRRYVITGGTPTWEGLDLKTSEQEMNDLGLSAFMTEKQQEDWEPEGNMFPSRYWRHDTTDPTRRRWLSMCRAWDLAGTEAKDADFTVGALMGIIDVDDELQVHVLHVERFQLEVAGVEQMVKHTAQLDRLDFGRHIPIVLEEQPGAAGKAWKRQWSKHLFGHSVWFVPPQGSKTIRAEPGASVLQQGLAYLNGGKWMNRFMRELGAFPTGRNDDQVDAYALGYNWMADRLGVNKKGSLHRRSAQIRVEHRAALPPAS